MNCKSLQGDLCQMYKQMDFLERKGLEVLIEGGIPYVKKDWYEYAVREIYETGITGWWNYKDDLISFNICTVEEFKKRLERQVSNG